MESFLFRQESREAGKYDFCVGYQEPMPRLTWSLALTISCILIFSILLIRSIWQHPENQQAIMNFLKKAQSHLSPHKPPQDVEAHAKKAITDLQPPTEKDVLRYKYHHGTNLGSIYVLERWLTPSMFHESAPGSSELTAVETWVKVEGVEAARRRFERHWREYISDKDLDWLRDVAKCTTVRLPIGFFTLGPEFCKHTAFEKVAPVYRNAWDAVRQLIGRCNQRGIGVLLDLHALPGGANVDEHSGTNSGKAELWGSNSNFQLAKKCICLVAREALSIDGIAGIQIVNEADWDAKGMYNWYDKVLSEVSKIDATIPMYFSDGWDLNRALAWSQSKNRTNAAHNPVVVDTHLYWAFTDTDKQKSPQQIVREASTKLSELDGKDGNILDHGTAQAIVGEYSCVLTEDSWAKRHDTPKEELVKAFGKAQSQRYQQRAGGSFFWTYRMDWMPGGEWGFKEMVDKGAITPPLSLTLSAAEVRERIASARQQRDRKRGDAFGAHCRYWDSNYPGHYEHWRYEGGWTLGFEDALAFFGMRGRSGLEGGDRIGMLDVWCLRRARELGMGGEKFGWEWEHGCRQGVRDFYEMVGV